MAHEQKPAFSPEALRELSEESADHLSEWYRERFGEPDSRGRWKERAIAAEAERVEAREDAREARKLISATHKRAVKHVNCTIDHCHICDGGLFVCADCGAAEIETEQRVCPGPGPAVDLIERACDAAEDYCADMPDLAGHGHSVGIKDAIRAALAPKDAVDEDRFLIAASHATAVNWGLSGEQIVRLFNQVKSNIQIAKGHRS